jgi:metallo-beta-lactamase family protein
MTTRSSVLTFLGAAQTVTGSRFLLESNSGRVLIDAGLFQGQKELRLRNWEPFPIDPSTLDGVVLTHAHLDHSGYLPALVRAGFDGPIWDTASTIALTKIVLEDSARLQEEEAEYANRKGFSKHRPALPLYTSEDAARAIAQLTELAFNEPSEVAEGIHAELFAAGHILGSASALLTLASGRRLFVSGDVGRPNHPILHAPAPRPVADIVLIESTYGNRHHDPEQSSLERIAQVINRTARRGGSIVIPAFAVDRTEVILHTLRGLKADERIPDLPVYVDSPMALAVLEVYRDAIDRNDPEIRLESRVADPFDPGRLHEARTTAQSKALNELTYPSIIISSSGMATGGRVLHHLYRRLPDPRNAVVLVGYQAAGTRGQLLAAGASTIKLLGRHVPVRSEVAVVDAFSVHADADEIVDWLAPAAGPETAYVVHGEPTASTALAAHLHWELEWTAVVPRHGECVRLD